MASTSVSLSTPSDITSKIRQSPRLSFPGTPSPSWLTSKTILITGGASGFGLLATRRWALAGATVISGDISPQNASLETTLRAETSNPNIHFLHCDVTSWPSQVSLFKRAVALSPHGGLDSVVANAGITDKKMEFENPVGLDGPDPPAPDLKCLEVNLTGVVYTAHLALFWLKRNPGSVAASPGNDPEGTKRDRHLLLVGSIASLGPIPAQAFYGASKHAVLGLYRCLRATSFLHGVRVSFVAPYFIDTPMVTAGARLLLAGAEIGRPEDVVEAMTRFVADTRIVGRAVCVCPPLRTRGTEDGGVVLAPVGGPEGEEKAVWEFNADDFETVEAWNRRMVGVLNAAEMANGWIGWAKDVVGALRYGIGAWWRVGSSGVV